MAGKGTAAKPSGKQRPPKGPGSPGYDRGRRAYWTIMSAVVVLALSSNPFGVLDYILREFTFVMHNMFCLTRRLSLLASYLSSKFKTPQCRCLYGESCWPSDKAFADLAEQVSQPLVYPRPPAAVCYSSSASEECSTALKGSLNGVWRAEQPGSMQNKNFETHVFPNGTISACYYNTSLAPTCEQGSIPVVGVDARSWHDVSAAVRFAARNHLRLTVKNTGYAFKL